MRTSTPSGFGPVHDVILYYVKTDAATWNQISQAYEQDYLDTKYRHSDDRGTYRLADLTGDGLRDGHSGKPWRGFDPSKGGRHWAVPRPRVEELLGEKANDLTTQEKLDLLDQHGYIYWTPRSKKGGSAAGFPQLKRYLGTGMPVQDVMTDIPPINSQAQERLGYPTQKPEALLERLISASSNEGDVVLDPFCGCGTTVAAAQKLKRSWIGIDITHLAVGLIKHRLRDAYGPGIEATYKVHGEPVDLGGAKRLAEDDKYEFQAWALGLVGARRHDQKKGADKGIDGRLYFHDEAGKTKGIILSVKGGHLKATDLRDLRGVVDREKGAIGVLISLEKPTAPMRKEAASAGFYTSPWDGGKYPKLQLRTVEELLARKGIEYPAKMQTNVTHKKAPRAKGAGGKQLTLADDLEAD